MNLEVLYKSRPHIILDTICLPEVDRRIIGMFLHRGLSGDKATVQRAHVIGNFIELLTFHNPFELKIITPTFAGLNFRSPGKWFYIHWIAERMNLILPGFPPYFGY